MFCSPCHGRTGEGNGMIVQRGIPAAAVVHGGSPAQRAGRLLLRRDDERLRRDAGLRGAGSGRGSLGDRRLHPRAAAQPARDGRRRAGRSPRRSRSACHGARRRGRQAGGPVNVTTSLAPARRHRCEPLAGADRRRRRRWSVCGIGFVVDRDQFFRAWLVALHAVPRHRARIDGADDDSAPVRRRRGAWCSAGSSRRRAARCRCWRSSSSRSCSGCSTLYPWTHPDLVAGRRGAAAQGGVSEPDVLPRPRGGLLRRLERDRVAAERVVARAGRGRRRRQRAACSG